MNETFFAPQLYIKRGTKDISFYVKAFDAIEGRRFTNDDGSIHVAELYINDAIFHLHEETSPALTGDNDNIKIGLFVPDVDRIMNKAADAGAVLLSPAEDYDHGYRQGMFRDPFGHCWIIQKKC